MKKDLLPQWIPKDAWNGYCDMRKLKKKPMTPGALTRTLNALEKMMQEGQDIALVLNQSEDQGFVGVFPVSDSYRRQRGLPIKNTRRQDHGEDRGYSGQGREATVTRASRIATEQHRRIQAEIDALEAGNGSALESDE